ncbi:YheT family hydrolase [Lewinella sp. 4G2]|uniref:YheT family hydrolase n=1 Tax=Lewinella sp. 4G2 TaxID=1803372 RepID=UPI0007B494A5|nr:alpha/beta fold hydrolase [Lewinella sp. 4G2]OAV44493.1 alpha/beta hydrolase [Lewinella sp. 4G2]
MTGLRGHYQTIVPNLFRKVPVNYRRERIDTPDGDFLDLDWLDQSAASKLVILSHGLEGDSSRVYVASAARFFHERGWEVLAWNCRSCSGEMNRTPRLYSHGQSEDVETVVNHALRDDRYEQVTMIGYSMGGNLTLKYLGTLGDRVPAVITHGIAFSAPVFIEHSADSLDHPGNWVYRRKFKRSLFAKIMAKEAQFPGRVNAADISKVKRWRDFDRYFSARIGGFDNVDDYYAYLSSGNFLAGTTTPVLIVNAKNDPIVPPACSPRELAATHPLVQLEEPALGGHVGFALRGKPYNGMDVRALAFIEGREP